MNGQKTASGGSNSLLQLCNIHEISGSLNINEPNSGPCSYDRSNGRDSCIGHGHHLVTLPNAQCFECEKEAISAIIDADTMFDTTIAGKGIFEIFNAFAKNQAPRAKYLLNAFQNVSAFGLIFFEVIPNLNFHTSVTPADLRR